HLTPILRTNLCFPYTLTTPAVLYPLSLHDALPISLLCFDREQTVSHSVYLGGGLAGWLYAHLLGFGHPSLLQRFLHQRQAEANRDRKSTRLNSSHDQISYAVFCLKKKKQNLCDCTV